MAERAGFAEAELRFSGSPFITGHAGLRVLRRLRLQRPFWLAERALLQLPRPVRERLCFSLTAVFRNSKKDQIGDAGG